MPVTASKTARYRILADDLDAALARGDEIGMDLLKSMLPELCESVEEINGALREIDTLLFEGLRDEAIGTHDADLPAVALRLHLEDKPQWPVAALFFESEGIKPPPPIDFAALTSLNSAYAELERLRKPLDKLRRLALERAPLPLKISLLRNLRKHDSSKPVWSEQLSAHEEVRVLELNDAVERAFVSRNPDTIAALHEELTNSDWGIPVPTRLKHGTQGGDVWAHLRHNVPALESIASQIESQFSADADGDTDLLDRVETLRQLRQDWLNGESRCRDWLFSLPQYTAIVGLAHTEQFGPRLDGLRDKVVPALHWLADIDQKDYLVDQFRQTCNELELLTETFPPRKGEVAWLARVDKLEADLQKLCQQLPQVKVAESLPMRIDRAVSDVRRRGRQRGRNVVVSAVLGLVVVAITIGIAAYWTNERRTRNEAIEYIGGVLALARNGEFVVSPERLDDYEARYRADAAIGSLIEEFDGLASLEQSRRKDFDVLVTEHEERLTQAATALAERDATQTSRLDEWPSAVFDAADRYRRARLKGGFPKKRKTVGNASSNKNTEEADLPPAARLRFDQEETRLAEQADKQSRMERSYSNATNDEYTRQLKEIEAAIPAADAPDAAALANPPLKKLDALMEQGRRPRSSSVESARRVPYSTLELAAPIKERLETIIRKAR